MTALRVVLGEDNYLARAGIVSVLGDIDDVELVATCEDLPSLRAAIDEHRPDVVLTDVRMPPTETDEGIVLSRELRTTHPEIGVVVLSQHVEPLYAVAVFEDGSERRAYLLKERLRDRDELARALYEVAAGGSVVDSRIVDEILSLWSRRDSGRLARLTPREHQILGLVAEGRSNTAIAEALVITKRAVERHINAIFAKLDLPESEDVSRRVKAALTYISEQAPGNDGAGPGPALPSRLPP